MIVKLAGFGRISSRASVINTAWTSSRSVRCNVVKLGIRLKQRSTLSSESQRTPILSKEKVSRGGDERAKEKSSAAQPATLRWRSEGKVRSRRICEESLLVLLRRKLMRRACRNQCSISGRYREAGSASNLRYVRRGADCRTTLRSKDALSMQLPLLTPRDSRDEKPL